MNFREFLFQKLSKKSLSGVSSAKIDVISQRNEPSLLCFVGFNAFVLRLARLFRQFRKENSRKSGGGIWKIPPPRSARNSTPFSTFRWMPFPHARNTLEGEVVWPSRGEALMADENTTNDVQAYAQPPQPSLDLKSLGNRLVGTWEVSGGAQGRVTYEWMDGGFFLVQRVELEQYGQKVRGIEVIGHLRPFGQEPSEDIKSRFYDSMATPSTTSMNWKGIPSRSGEGRRVLQRTSKASSATTATPSPASGCTRVAAGTSRP
jgi:hypothetical protein